MTEELNVHPGGLKPQGGHHEEDWDKHLQILKHESLADYVVDSAIEEAMLRRAEREQQ